MHVLFAVANLLDALCCWQTNQGKTGNIFGMGKPMNFILGIQMENVTNVW